uniref:Uncharacterized protein n=1 Tax=Rhizophora mucronata TaxID=61149 RepID=A0A2P2P0K7_RHIMU
MFWLVANGTITELCYRYVMTI